MLQTVIWKNSQALTGEWMGKTLLFVGLFDRKTDKLSLETMEQTSVMRTIHLWTFSAKKEAKKSCYQPIQDLFSVLFIILIKNSNPSNWQFETDTCGLYFNQQFVTLNCVPSFNFLLPLTGHLPLMSHPHWLSPPWCAIPPWCVTFHDVPTPLNMAPPWLMYHPPWCITQPLTCHPSLMCHPTDVSPAPWLTCHPPRAASHSSEVPWLLGPNL